MLKSLDKIAVADIKKEIVSHFSIGHSKKVGGKSISLKHLRIKSLREN